MESKGDRMEKLDVMKNFVVLPVDKMALAEWNYKTENEELTEKLKNNIKLNGQIENIIVRELDTGFFEVVNGNHRLVAMKDLGFEQVVCYNLGKNVSDEKAQRIAIETNETKFEADNIKLATLISSILKKDSLEDLVGTMPYSKDDLENFQKMLDFNWGEMEDKPAHYDEEDFETISLKLPSGVASQVWEQIERFKKILHPEEKDLKKVSYVMAVEAICQVLAQTPDKDVTGE